MKTTSLADARAQLSKYVDEVVTTHERVSITRNGRPAAVLISVDDLESLQETLFWAGQDPVSEDDLVDAETVRAELVERAQAAGRPDLAERLLSR